MMKHIYKNNLELFFHFGITIREYANRFLPEKYLSNLNPSFHFSLFSEQNKIISAKEYLRMVHKIKRKDLCHQYLFLNQIKILLN